MKFRKKNNLSNSQKPPLSHGFLRYNHALLIVENLIKAIFPFLGWFCFLFALGNFGFFSFLNENFKNLFIIFIAISFVFLLLPLKFIKQVKQKDVAERLEKDNQIPFQALQVQYDVNFFNKGEPTSINLWQEHQKIMLETFSNITRIKFRPLSKKNLKLLSFLIFMLMASFLYKNFEKNHSIQDLFYTYEKKPTYKFDAYVKGPNYASQPPIYLTPKNAFNKNFEKSLSISQESQIYFHFFDHCYPLYRIDKNQQKHKIFPLENYYEIFQKKECSYQHFIENGDRFIIANEKEKFQWKFDVKSILKPQIVIDSENIFTTIQGDLSLNYQLIDNFGFQEASLIIKTEEDKNLKKALPFIAKRELNLSNNGVGKKKLKINFARFPLAGKKVQLSIIGKTKKGEIIKSNDIKIFLPFYKFYNPLAAAINEIRQMILLNHDAKNKTVYYLSALQTHASTTINDATTIIALSSATTRLSYLRTIKDLQNYTQYLWKIATNIEERAIGKAKRNLKNAENQLKQALKKKADSETVKNLTDNLRQAMQDYLKEAPKKNTFKKELSKNTKILSQKDIDELLKKIEEETKKGNIEEAEKLLQQFSQLMENIHSASPQEIEEYEKNQNSKKSKFDQQMDKLGDIIQKQQMILNQTHQLQSQEDKQGKNSETLEHLKHQQKKLKQELDDLIRDLEMHSTEEKNIDSLKNAKKNMEKSEDFLSNQSFYQSEEEQKMAIDFLRNSAQNFMKKIRKKEEEKDPLGRKIGPNGEGSDEDKKLKNLDQKERNRNILDDIRKKYQNKDLKPDQKQYFKRLLDIFR